MMASILLCTLLVVGSAPDRPTPIPLVGSFLVYETPNGEWRVGAPWIELFKKKKKKRKEKETKGGR